MEFKEIYTDFNDFYYYRLNDMIKSAREDSNSLSAKLLNKLKEKEIDLSNVLYKKLVDDYEEVNIESQKIGLLPMGFINTNIPNYFIKKDVFKAGRYGNGNTFDKMFLQKPNFIPIYYPEEISKPLKSSFKKVCSSYIEHYKKSLDEEWSEEEFYAMLSELKFLSVKYAIDLETKEIFAVGFFGAAIRNGAGGKSLTNAELYVMPEFRNMGIAKKMVGLTFELAKENNIENFDSITYRVQSCDALTFWQKVGASVSGLTHIEGNIPNMIETIDKSNKQNKRL